MNYIDNDWYVKQAINFDGLYKNVS